MLDRTTLAPPRVGIQGSTAVPSAGMAVWLLRFFALVAAASILACVYIWQANTISEIKTETLNLSQEAKARERTNARMMLELAQLDSPARIEREATLRGLAPTRAAVVLPVPETRAPSRPTGTDWLLTSPGDWLTDLVHRVGLGPSAAAEMEALP